MMISNAVGQNRRRLCDGRRCLAERPDGEQPGWIVVRLLVVGVYSDATQDDSTALDYCPACAAVVLDLLAQHDAIAPANPFLARVARQRASGDVLGDSGPAHTIVARMARNEQQRPGVLGEVDRSDRAIGRARREIGCVCSDGETCARCAGGSCAG